MKKWIFFLILLFLISCKTEKKDSYFTSGKASKYFKTVEEACNQDNGKLWGKNLYGPIMVVERTSRKVIANQPDKEGLLKGKDGIYTGIYPKELILNNVPVMFGGSQFAMVPLPPEEDEYRIKTRIIHSLFHRFQESEGINPSSFNESNMDEKEARLWIKLEWKALRKALNTKGDERHLAIRDALIFRGSNRELYQKFTADENRFETYEGLATFTYTMFCSTSPEDFKAKLFENLDRIYSMQSYSRSYGFIHGALYASLLYDKGFDFSTIKTTNYDLGKENRRSPVLREKY